MKRRFLALFTALTLMLSMTIPSYADTTYSNGATSGSIAVTATVSSTYQITLPATLELNYIADQVSYNYGASYTVGVKANLTDSEYITVTPDSSFTMSSALANATANVSQPVNTWRNTAGAANEIAASYTSFVTTTGNITTQLDVAGSYAGTLNFTFLKATD